MPTTHQKPNNCSTFHCWEFMQRKRVICEAVGLGVKILLRMRKENTTDFLYLIRHHLCSFEVILCHSYFKSSQCSTLQSSQWVFCACPVNVLLHWHWTEMYHSASRLKQKWSLRRAKINLVWEISPVQTHSSYWQVLCTKTKSTISDSSKIFCVKFCNFVLTLPNSLVHKNPGQTTHTAKHIVRCNKILISVRVVWNTKGYLMHVTHTQSTSVCSFHA